MHPVQPNHCKNLIRSSTSLSEALTGSTRQDHKETPEGIGWESPGTSGDDGTMPLGSKGKVSKVDGSTGPLEVWCTASTSTGRSEVGSSSSRESHESTTISSGSSSSGKNGSYSKDGSSKSSPATASSSPPSFANGATANASGRSASGSCKEDVSWALVTWTYRRLQTNQIWDKDFNHEWWKGGCSTSFGSARWMSQASRKISRSCETSTSSGQHLKRG